MEKVMDFQNWLFNEENSSPQVQDIVDEIANKFNVGGLPDTEKLNFQLDNLEQEQKNNGQNEVPISIKTSLKALGPIRNMTDEQKQKFEDMIDKLPLTTTIGDLAQKVVSIISGQQK
jgi:hypothetical protein